ncbi:putative secreted protein [Granulibacter bethesdensis]|uniref:Secreted protein n=1 Tax=Granulibacter bethesdensis TaxID=364410 RepID=A0AAC9P9C8_9PROT|nr:hypothetical protein [Granulibacter bethesdensis]APH55461.1 putative secreted protein [Granulibacter bethesdensis]APH63047.1 putative secreted protein [Granulibacter bethesdensis]
MTTLPSGRPGRSRHVTDRSAERARAASAVPAPTTSSEALSPRVCGEAAMSGGRSWFTVQGPRSQLRTRMEQRIEELERCVAELRQELEALRSS